MPSDLELVRQRHAGIGHAVPKGPSAQDRDFVFKFQNPVVQIFPLDCDVDHSIERAHVARFSGVQGSGTFRAIAVNGDRFQSQPPSFHVSVHDVVNGRVLRHVHRFRNRATEERLRCRHHSQMCDVMEAALPEMRAKGAIKNREMLRPQRRRIKPACLRCSRENGRVIGARRGILNGVEEIDMLDDARDLFLRITQMLQRRSNRLVNDF